MIDAKALEAACAVLDDRLKIDCDGEFLNPTEAMTAAITAYLAAMEEEKMADDWWHPKHYGPDWMKSPAVIAAQEGMEAEGFVMVPVEPTEGMADAAEEEMEQRRSHGCRVYASDVWEAMIAARPIAKS